MNSDYLRKSLDYSGAFEELYGFVSAVYDRSDNDDVRRIYTKFLLMKDVLDYKYLNDMNEV